jgi:putative inorganic carbon (HCO3(-)) transporter
MLDWLLVLGAVSLLANAAARGLTFMPAAGFLTNRQGLLVFEYACLVLGGLGVLRRLLGGRVMPGAPLWVLAAVAAVCFMSLAHTVVLYPAREEVFFLTAAAVLALTMLIALNDALKTHALIAGAVLIAVGEAIIALRQFASGAPTPAYWLGEAFAGVIQTRAYGTLGSPNVLAGFLLLGIAGAAILTMSLPAIWRVVPAAALAVQIAALGTTYSRGGYAGLAVFGLAAAALSWPVRRRAWPMLLVVALAAGVVLAALPAATRRAESISPGQEDTATSRRYIWKTGVAVWKAHRTWGTGIGTFNAVYSPFRPQSVLATYAMIGIPGSAHNDYLQILAETGLAGAALLGLASLWGLWRAGRRYARGDASDRVWLLGWAAGIAGIGAMSIVDENLYIVTNVTMLLLLSTAVSAHVALSARPPAGVGRRVLILPLAAVLIGLAPLLGPPVRATVLHDEATLAVKAGEYPRAIALFQKAMAADPLDAVTPAYFGDLLADLYIRRLNTSMGPWQSLRKQAAAYYRLASRLDPWNAYPHAELGRLRRAERRYAEAAAALREAVRLDPYTPRYRLWLGEALAEAGNRTAARTALEEALRLYPIELTTIAHHEGQSGRFQGSLAQMAEARRSLTALDRAGR